MTPAEMYAFAGELYPLPRSLTGWAVRETLDKIKRKLPGLKIHSVPSGARAYDWTVPEEWNVEHARLYAPDGSVLCSWNDNPLHLIGYSEPVEKRIEQSQRAARLFSVPDNPHRIPYITGYYHREVSHGGCGETLHGMQGDKGDG